MVLGFDDLASASSSGDLALFVDGFLFRAIDSTGMEPWFSDGTRYGTSRLVDQTVGLNSSAPDLFTVVGNSSVFIAHDKETGYELCVTDDTSAGTGLIVDINGNGVELADSFLFATNHRTSGGFELWSTEGTPDDKNMLCSINSSADYLLPWSNLTYEAAFTPIGDDLIFVVDDGTNG